MGSSMKKMPQKPFGYIEIGDNAVAQRADGDYLIGRFSEHPAGFLAHGVDLSRYLFDRNDRGLAKHDALVLNENENA